MTVRHYLIFFLLSSCLASIVHGAGLVNEPLWVANGPVNAIASHDAIDHLFVNGQFSYIEPGTGAMAIHSQTGQFDTGFPHVNGPIYALSSDGLGGWYIGGQFTGVGGLARNNLAYVSWDAITGWSVEDWNAGANDAVFALALSADGNTLYVGGAFTTINNGAVLRRNLAALATDTGAASNWDPGVNKPVRALQRSIDGAVLYIGGDFDLVGQGSNVKVRRHAAAIGIAALDTNNLPHPDYGLPLDWDPDTNGVVYALSIATGRMYLGGNFTQMKGGAVQRRYAAAVALDAVADVDPSWNPQPNQLVRTITAAGARVYLGGDFSTLNSIAQAQPYVAAVDNSNGFIDSGWRPGIDAPVYSLLASPDGRLFIGGEFTHVNGQERNRLAALDLVSAALNDWQPASWLTVRVLSGFGSTVVSGGGFDRESRRLVYIGGEFDYVGPVTGSAVSLDSEGQVDASLLQIDGVIYSLISDGSGGWFMGGQFSTVAGVPRANLAHIDATGSLTDWDPGADGVVNILLRTNSGQLFVGGAFATINASLRPNLALVSTVDGAVANWDAGVVGTVRTLLLNAGVLYVGGNFFSSDGSTASIGGQPRDYLAALNVADGSAIPTWDADIDGPVLSIETSDNASTASIFVGGEFTQINGVVSRPYLAEVSTADGTVTAWDAGVSGVVRSLLRAGSVLYAGGDFYSIDGSVASIGGQAHDYLAALNTADATAVSNWRGDANAPVHVIQLNGADLYVGGQFTLIGDVSRNRIALVAAASGVVQGWNPSAGGDVFAIGLDAGQAWVGGDFASVGGKTRRNLAALDLLSGQADAWNPGVSGAVHSLLVSGSVIYIGGQFNVAGGQYRNNLAALDKSTGVAMRWNPDADSTVLSIKPTNNNAAILVGGAFSHINTLARNGLAEVNLNGQATAWNANLDNGAVINAVVVTPTIVYLAGDFSITTSAGPDVLARNLAALNVTGTNLLTWRPAVNGVVNTLLPSPDGARLYIGGEFTIVDNTTRLHLAALDLQADPDAAYVLGWAVDTGAATDSVQALAMSQDRTTLFVGGDFSVVGGAARNNLAAVQVNDGVIRNDWLASTDGQVSSLLINDDLIFAGGMYKAMDGLPRSHLAGLSILPAETDAPQTQVSLPGGNYNSNNLQEITLICDDGPGSGCAATFYAIDGGPWLTYNNPLSLKQDAELHYFSVDHVGNSEDSTVNSDIYILEVTAPTTTISPASGVYDSYSLMISLICSDDQSGCAETYYTLNDSTPTLSSTRYTGPFEIRGRTVVKYFSIDQVGNQEPVRRSTFVSSQGGSGAISPVVLFILTACFCCVVRSRSSHA